ncbi:hypothetical protein L4C36_23020 [Photobacterium japonica]|uniref:hypothetical protein n=1 Tax=Photobacterium japonica TaxID=2910235 RepID=UPI003D0E345A
MKNRITKRNRKKNPFKVPSKSTLVDSNSLCANKTNIEQEAGMAAPFDGGETKVSKFKLGLNLISQREWTIVKYLLCSIVIICAYFFIRDDSPVLAMMLLMSSPILLLCMPMTFSVIVGGMWKMLFGKDIETRYIGVCLYSFLILPILALWVGRNSHFMGSIESDVKIFAYTFMYMGICIVIAILASLLKSLAVFRKTSFTAVSLVLLSIGLLIVEMYYPYPETRLTSEITTHCYEKTKKEYEYRSSRVRREYEIEQCFVKFTYDGEVMRMFLHGSGTNVKIRHGLIDHYTLSH